MTARPLAVSGAAFVLAALVAPAVLGVSIMSIMLAFTCLVAGALAFTLDDERRRPW